LQISKVTTNNPPYKTTRKTYRIARTSFCFIRIILQLSHDKTITSRYPKPLFRTSITDNYYDDLDRKFIRSTIVLFQDRTIYKSYLLNN
jgi:hypothetical protein